jgi:curli biogenesis system outer membrane secretion channel CsgG
MKKLFLYFVLLLIGSTIYSKEIEAPKKRLAVSNFEDKSGNNWYKHDLGSGMADMLTTSLFKTGKFSMVERQAVNKVMEEQALGASGAVTQGSAAKLGKLLGTSAIITGSVTEFGVKDGGGRVGGLGGLTKGLVSGIGVKSNTARVGIDLRIVDTITGEILLAESSSGEETSRSIDFASWSLPDFKMGGNNFDNSLIGKATRKAIDSLIEKIDGKMKDVSWKGYILKVDGNSIWLNAGSDSGVKEGMKFKVRNQGEEIEDAEGKTYIIPGDEVAEIEVTKTLPTLSKVKIVSGSGVEKDMEVIYK